MASESEVLFSGGDEGRQKERGSSVPMAAESERQQRVGRGREGLFLHFSSVGWTSDRDCKRVNSPEQWCGWGGGVFRARLLSGEEDCYCYLAWAIMWSSETVVGGSQRRHVAEE